MLQRILRIVTKEDGWFLSDGDRAHHESLALSWAKRSDRLLGLSLQPYDGFGDSFRFLWKTVRLNLSP